MFVQKNAVAFANMLKLFNFLQKHRGNFEVITVDIPKISIYVQKESGDFNKFLTHYNRPISIFDLKF